ncbi:hypothetical protein OsI_02308 [Oryza sativa Indica Group]|uniref:DUF3778 domain-containing protein n=1 Tax=Oryza sativa subsp. indica TaxID=39946 RepID=A2WR23_ORYSI|nr:hypothetical protein OsI_02308 [Oryza sativa Indica Group]
MATRKRPETMATARIRSAAVAAAWRRSTEAVAARMRFTAATWLRSTEAAAVRLRPAVEAAAAAARLLPVAAAAARMLLAAAAPARLRLAAAAAAPLLLAAAVAVPMRPATTAVVRMRPAVLAWMRYGWSPLLQSSPSCYQDSEFFATIFGLSHWLAGFGEVLPLCLTALTMQGLSFRVEHRLDLQSWFAGLQYELLRFNDELRGNLLRSPVMLTPKSTASQQTSHMCRFRGGNRRGFPVCQAECTSIEALGCSRRGIAVVPCRFAPLLLSFIRKFASFFQLTSLVKDGPTLMFILGDVSGIQFP